MRDLGEFAELRAIIRRGSLVEERPKRRDLHIAVIVCEIQLFFRLQFFHQAAEPILNIVSPCFGIDDGPKFDFEVPVYESSHPSLNVIRVTVKLMAEPQSALTKLAPQFWITLTIITLVNPRLCRWTQRV
jgi:hypothetical protein